MGWWVTDLIIMSPGLLTVGVVLAIGIISAATLIAYRREKLGDDTGDETVPRA
jgi:hypothetical protein